MHTPLQSRPLPQETQSKTRLTTVNPCNSAPPYTFKHATFGQLLLNHQTLAVNVDLSSNVDLFAYPADAAVNPVYVAATVSAADISGLFEYLENPKKYIKVII